VPKEQCTTVPKQQCRKVPRQVCEAAQPTYGGK
jgi:hypothetical protein